MCAVDLLLRQRVIFYYQHHVLLLPFRYCFCFYCYLLTSRHGCRCACGCRTLMWTLMSTKHSKNIACNLRLPSNPTNTLGVLSTWKLNGLVELTEKIIEWPNDQATRIRRNDQKLRKHSRSCIIVCIHMRGISFMSLGKHNSTQHVRKAPHNKI